MSGQHDLQIWRAAMEQAAHVLARYPVGMIDRHIRLLFADGAKAHSQAIISARDHGPTSPLPPDPELASLREKVKALEGQLDEATQTLKRVLLDKAKLDAEVAVYREANRHRYGREGHDRGVMTSPHGGKNK